MAIVQLETDQMLTALRLLRSSLSEEQLQTPAVQFFNDSCPNISFIENEESGQLEMKFKGGGDGSLDGRDIQFSLLNQRSSFYPFSSLHFAAAELASEGGIVEVQFYIGLIHFSGKKIITNFFLNQLVSFPSGRPNMMSRDSLIHNNWVRCLILV